MLPISSRIIIVYITHYIHMCMSHPIPCTYMHMYSRECGVFKTLTNEKAKKNIYD